MADQKTEKKLTDEEEMKKHFRMLLQLKKVEMVRDLKLLPETEKPQEKK